jgi:XTP/dITP diphosphohydrolase
VIRLVVATRNRGKLRDVRHLLSRHGLDLKVEVVAVSDLEPPPAEVEETGATFAENAILKARQVSAASGLPALGDDSGLEVDALGGAPGVYSARYAGVGSGRDADAANNAKLLGALAGVAPERRTARFRSAVAFADAHGPLGEEVLLGEGVCEGRILEAPRGTGGFGYDPLFFSPELSASFAEADIAAKGAVSHRSRAMTALAPELAAYLRARGGGAGGAGDAGDG